MVWVLGACLFTNNSVICCQIVFSGHSDFFTLFLCAEYLIFYFTVYTISWVLFQVSTGFTKWVGPLDFGGILSWVLPNLNKITMDWNLLKVKYQIQTYWSWVQRYTLVLQNKWNRIYQHERLWSGSYSLG